ncbi:MAG: hypothetical protein ACPHCI_06145 [Solirubrobacterales bacterium]
MTSRIVARKGASIGLKATFTDEAGTLIDPATVTGKSKSPDGTVSDLTPTNPSTGVYTIQTDTDATGIWVLEVKGDDNFDTVERLEFNVLESLH